MKKTFFVMDIGAIIIVLIFFYHLSHLQPMVQDSVINNLVRFTWLSTPLLLAFLILRLLKLKPITSLYVILWIYFALSYISHKKSKLTGEPLSFNDLIAISNISVASKYTSTLFLIYSFIALLILFSIFLIENKFTGKEKFSLPRFFLTALLVPFSFYLYFLNQFSLGSNSSNLVKNELKKYKINYIQYNWAQNESENGLPMHLIQTSARKSIPSNSLEQSEYYDKYNKDNLQRPNKTSTIIYILCEACWYDDNNFKSIFQPLLDSGFKESRAISPVYGGGTANAEFEMFTGLPSHSKYISGIVYQEYVSFISEHADTLPQRLKDNGYITYAAHNNNKEFWHRNVIYPKFGFTKFHDINEMGELPSAFYKEKKLWQWAADDYLLFNAAIKELKAKKNDNIFMSLITMSTHGPYHIDNDFGEKAYSYQLTQAISRITAFSEQVKKIDPDALIIIYGDHKPALNDFFINKGILKSNVFGSGPYDYGDVPVLIKSRDSQATDDTIKDSKGKPFFCLTNAIDKNFIGTRIFSFDFYEKNGCFSNGDYDYNALVSRAPPWLYSLAIFE